MRRDPVWIVFIYIFVRTDTHKNHTHTYTHMYTDVYTHLRTHIVVVWWLSVGATTVGATVGVVGRLR